MSAQGILRSLFMYKISANEGLFAEFAKIDQNERQSEQHAAIRVLNHIYVVDRIFAAHLSGQKHGYSGTNTPETPSVDRLRSAVAQSDRSYVEYVENVLPEKLQEVTSSPSPMDRRGLCRGRKCLRTSPPMAITIAAPSGVSCLSYLCGP